MSTDQIVISLIIIITFGLFIWGRWRYDIISLLALFSLVFMDSILGGKSSRLISDPGQGRQIPEMTTLINLHRPKGFSDSSKFNEHTLEISFERFNIFFTIWTILIIPTFTWKV